MTSQSGQRAVLRWLVHLRLIVTVVVSLVFEPPVLTLAAGHRPGLVTLPDEGR